MTQMTEHRDFEAMVVGYALGALEPGEVHVFENHLSGCQACQADLAEYRRVMAGIALAADERVPPPELKARVLARATGKRQDSARVAEQFVERTHGRRASDRIAPPADHPPATAAFWRLAAAAGIVLAIAGGVYAITLYRQVGEMRTMLAESDARSTALAQQLTAVRRDSAQLAQMAAVLSAADMVRVELKGQPGAPQAVGRAMVSPSRGLVFNAQHLPPLTSGRVYQLWVIAGGAPVGAGVLTMAPDGTGTFSMPMPASLGPMSAVAVTAEPGPDGSKAPTSPILLIGEMK